MSVGAKTPDPPYYAVIFTSRRTAQDDAGYGEMADRMEELARRAARLPGHRERPGADRVGITVSYWSSLEALRAWGRQSEHLMAQKLGRDRWYEAFELRVCRVEEAWGFGREENVTGVWPSLTLPALTERYWPSRRSGSGTDRRRQPEPEASATARSLGFPPRTRPTTHVSPPRS